MPMHGWGFYISYSEYHASNYQVIGIIVYFISQVGAVRYMSNRNSNSAMHRQEGSSRQQPGPTKLKDQDSFEQDKIRVLKSLDDKAIVLVLCAIIIVLMIVGSIIYQTQAQKNQRIMKYFISKATIHQASQPLANKASPITWPQLGSLQIVNMTVTFLTSGRTQMLMSTLESFFKYNTYPLHKIYAIHDGQPSDELMKVIDRYPNITWIVSNLKLGQLTAVDLVFRFVDTEYYFHSEDDWEYLRPGFIEYCLQALNLDNKLNGLHLTHKVKLRQPTFVKGPLWIMTEAQMQWYSGFSFYPSVHRMKEYRQLDNGYTGATFNESFGKGVGNCQSFISIQYTMWGYHYARSVPQFVDHTGANKGSPVKFFEPPQDPRWANVSNHFGNWIINNGSREQILDSLSYLDPIVQKLPKVDNNTSSGTIKPAN